MLPQLLWYCAKVMRNQWLKPSELKRTQEKKLRSIIQHAYKNVKFYHEMFDLQRIKPEDIKTTEDLLKLPVITKEVVRNKFPDQIVANGVNMNECRLTQTSGTIGEPMTIVWNKEYRRKLDVGHRLRRLSANGFKPGDKMVHISQTPVRRKLNERSRRGLVSKALKSLYDHFFRNLTFKYEIDKILSELAAFQPTAIKSSARECCGCLHQGLWKSSGVDEQSPG